jgi:glycosyltransferase involved in cell wall biosynthesis
LNGFPVSADLIERRGSVPRRFVFVNRSYWPDSEATGQLLEELCEHLAESAEVHVICGQPNACAPNTNFSRKGNEIRNGVVIHRLEHTRYSKRWPAGRLLNLLSFTRATSRYLRSSGMRAEVFVCETDPFLLPLIVARHTQRVGSRFIAYLQDIYPDVAVAIGKAKEGIITGRIRRQLRAAYQRADRIVVLGDDMKARLVNWGLDAAKMEILPNWVDCDLIQPVKTENRFRQTHGFEDNFVVMHSGNMGLTQRLDVLVEATRDPAWPENAVLALVGDGAMRTKLQSQASQLPPGRIHFFPYQPKSMLADSLSAADLHVVSMDHRITGCLFPSKFYGILASGTPVLMISPNGSEPVRLVDEHKVGWTCQPGDSAGIAQAIRRASLDSNSAVAGENARKLAIEKYDRQVACRAFQSIIESLFPLPSPDLATNLKVSVS